ncbi:MAG: hypothetical protein V1739_10175, partial [Candidatus Omnitrophota bacterium]
YKQLIALICLIHILPAKAIEKMLTKKWYLKLPVIDMYNFVDIVPFFINCLKIGRAKRWFPLRGTRHRYIFFGRKIVLKFLLVDFFPFLLKKIISVVPFNKSVRKYTVLKGKSSIDLLGVDK